MRLSIDRRVALMVAVMLLVAGLPVIFSAQAGAASTSLVINEIDYDQPGTDTAEFVEIKNVSSSTVNLAGWTVELVNGTDGGASIYNTVALPSVTLAAGDYFVFCGSAANVANCDLVVPPPTNLIQNGAPDAVGLLNGGTLIDTVSYEGDTGAPYTEGSGSGLVDSSSFEDAGISRLPDGTDTDENNVDLSQVCITPGEANVTVAPPCVIIPVLTIGEIQGAGHLSPYLGRTVTTSGVVTAVAFDGYYIQDPGDDDNNTSDGMFVFMGSAPKPAIGDVLELTDVVNEFIPGGAGTSNLSITQMAFPIMTQLSTGNPLPAPSVIGRSGRIPPNVFVISQDKEPVNLQVTNASSFDPDTDGIDFYESVEGMLVTVEDPVAVSATRRFGSFSSEFFTLANDGADVAPKDARTKRGGIELQPDPDNRGDQNPERIQIQFDASPTTTGTLYPGSAPIVTVNDRLGDVTGVVGYDFGNFEVRATELVTVDPRGLGAETTNLDGKQNHVSVASYNVLNLSPLGGDDNQRATLAAQVVNNLGSPDVIALQEIQDNDGTTDNGVTDATETLNALRIAVINAGGPDYSFCDVEPVDGSTGGVPGGNIRNAFFYNADRVELIGDCTIIDDAAFFGTRRPLVGTFGFNNREFTVINNHLSSRFGSTPVFGAIQPFIQAAQAERTAQSQALNDAVDAILASDPVAMVAVVGDMNTFQWTTDLAAVLPGTGPERVLTNLTNQLNDDNVYSFNFEGNSQVLDHFFVSDALLPAKYDIVHVNVDFPRVDNTVGSDHEPVVARLKVGNQGKGKG